MVVWLGAGTDIMKFVAGAQCHRGGKTVLRYLRGPAGAGERRDAPLEVSTEWFFYCPGLRAELRRFGYWRDAAVLQVSAIMRACQPQ